MESKIIRRNIYRKWKNHQKITKKIKIKWKRIIRYKKVAKLYNKEKENVK